ncbi:MAG: TonB-dependent receptor [Halieaceae bacterium]|jgi:iron complex outermembrane receptor protein|nr:TonB-dependent receptor [Halieaceae bacterium]
MKKQHHMRLSSTPKRLLTVACSAAILAGFNSLPTLAQNELALEEVIVSATRRDESIQDVAVSVAAITRELSQAQVRRLEDLQTFSPSTYIRRYPGGGSIAFINIRGVGTTDYDKSLDPPIGVIMDGLFLGTASGVLMQNFDIERIEILRGPQGTLFGKNTTGGLINVTRGDVTMEWGGDFSVAVDEHGREDVKGVVNVPLIDDKLGVKLFGAQIKSDGWVYNTTRNEDVGGDDIVNYGFAMKWQPNDNFDLKWHYEKMKDQSDQGAYVNTNDATDLTCAVYQQCFSNTSDNETQNSSDGTNFSDNEYDTNIITANWQMNDGLLLTYIGGFREQDEQNMQDFDGSPAPMLRMNFYNDWEQTSHELRLSSTSDGPFQFIAGLYSFDVDYEQRWDVFDLHATLAMIGALGPGVSLPFTTASSNGQEQETESMAAFFSMDYSFNDAWTMTVGGRYTEEEKDFLGGNGGVFYIPGQDPIPALKDPKPYDGKWTNFSPSASLKWQVNDDTMVWASYAEGFKSGGFFGRQANFDCCEPSFEPEFVTNYELGLKKTMLDGKLTFNPTVFFSDYEDKQESILIPIDLSNVATVVRNASTQEIFGVELEMSYQITEKWFLRASYGYIDAEYDSYLADITGDQIVTDNSSLIPRNVPENTFGMSTTYTADMGPGSLQTSLSFRYRDEVEHDPTNDPIGHMDSITDLSGQISYLWGDNRYRLSVYGKNLTDKQELAQATIHPLITRGWYNPPRTIGAEFAISF